MTEPHPDLAAASDIASALERADLARRAALLEELADKLDAALHSTGR